jgi:hypothetical protein
VAGRTQVRAADLKAKLGDPAWYVLQQLWKLRAKDGETHVTNAGLARGAAGYVRQAVRVINKACERLAKAGLVKLLGRRPRQVPRGVAVVTLRVVCRRVHGAPAEGALGAELFCFVPAATARWIDGAATWGGKRIGAGRPTRIQEGEVFFQEGEISGPGTEFKRGSRSLFSSPFFLGPDHPETSFQDAAARGGASVLGLLPGGESDPTDAPESPRRKGTAVERNGAALASSDPTLGVDLIQTPERNVGLRLAGTPGNRPKAPSVPTAPLPGTPPPPWTLVGLAAVPNPPDLDPEMKPTERTNFLASAFNGAVASRFPGYGDAFRSGSIRANGVLLSAPVRAARTLHKSKDYALLVEAAQFMLDHEIAPAAWAAWSCDMWKVHHTTKKPPPVAWVFGTKRLAERRGWFEAEERSYMGGSVKYGRVQEKLIRRYLTMRFEIHNACAWDDPAPFVAKWFPDDLFERMVAAAKAEVARAQEKLRAAADRGEFLW